MLMNELIPRFREFCEQEVLQRGFDYIVPIETKGMLVFGEALANTTLLDSRIRFRRAFDFLSLEELNGKTVALLDDTVVVGRTLRTSEYELKGKGVLQVAKYAFISYDDPENRPVRRIDDVKLCSTLSKLDYSLILEELSRLSMRNRPSYPDHLIFYLQFDDTYPTDFIAQLCSRAGTFVEYDIDEASRTCSLHYPTFTPALKEYAGDSGSNRLNLTIGYEGNWLLFSPIFFPSLRHVSEPILEDTLWEKFYTLLDRPWHTRKTKLVNLYESFALGMRTRMALNFIAFLGKAGIKQKALGFQGHRLSQYYGDELSGQITKSIIEAVSGTSLKKSSVNDSSVSDGEQPPDMYTLTEALLKALDSEYREANRFKPDKFDWESAGLNVEELSLRTGYSKVVVSIGLEHLDNYGYATPMLKVPTAEDTGPLQRVYRSTEIGTMRLRL